MEGVIHRRCVDGLEIVSSQKLMPWHCVYIEVTYQSCSVFVFCDAVQLAIYICLIRPMPHALIDPSPMISIIVDVTLKGRLKTSSYL